MKSDWQNAMLQAGRGQGTGVVVHGTLMLLFAVSAAAWFGASTFQGLKDAGAMDAAQCARVWAETGSYGTRCLRPAELALLAPKGGWGAEGGESAGGEGAEEKVQEGPSPLPELTRPPLWPWWLSLHYRVFGAPSTGVQEESWTFRGDWIPLWWNMAFLAGAAFLAGGLARRMFNGQVGLLTTSSCLIAQAWWARGIVGSEWGMGTFLAMGGLWAAVAAADEGDEGRDWRGWAAAALAGLLWGAAFLTRYACGAAGLAGLGVLWMARGTAGKRKALLCAVLAAAVVAPWLARDASLCGRPFGMLLWEALDGTYLYRDGMLERRLSVELPGVAAAWTAIQFKGIANLRDVLCGLAGWGGTGLLAGLWAAGLLHRYRRPASRRLRWWLIPAAVVLAVGAAAFGAESMGGLLPLWAVAAAYGWAFLLIQLERMEIDSRLVAALPVAAVLIVTALPMVVRVLPPKTGVTYPPYFHRYAAWAGGLAEEGEWLATDMPWATAWYAGRASVLTPASMDDFLAVHERVHPLGMAYFTLATFNKPWMRDLAGTGAPEADWYRILRDGRVPSTFPLQEGHFLLGGDQLLLSDRVRWQGPE